MANVVEGVRQPVTGRHARPFERFFISDISTWRDRAGTVVHGLGFAEEDLDRPLETFSGGELTRGSLARALASRPDLLPDVYIDELMDHVASGRLVTNDIITHVLPLAEGPLGFDVFNQKKDGCVKVVLKPGMAA